MVGFGQIRILENETKEGGVSAAAKRKMNAQVTNGTCRVAIARAES